MPLCTAEMTGSIVRPGDAEPANFAAVDLDRFIAHHMLQNQRRCPSGDGKTIGLGPVVKMIRRDDAARARHVLDDPRRIARQILADMARHQPRVLVVGAAR